MKTNLLGVTRALAIGGACDYSFCDEEAKWRGGEIHRMTELYDRGTLNSKSVPVEIAGFLAAHMKFMRETAFICTEIEREVKSTKLGLRGRLDRYGLMKGKRTVVDFKSGAVNPATALQLALYGNLYDAGNCSQRIAVQLKSDGTYSVKVFPLMQWWEDLNTAHAFVRVAKWRLKNGVAKEGRGY
jgi:hypothetical protein